MWRIILYLLLALGLVATVLVPMAIIHAETRIPKHVPSDPLNVPLDSLGVKGYDRTLCSDRWGSCSHYDREQFDTKYPGQPLDELSLYPLDKASRRGDYRTERDDYKTGSRQTEE